MRDRWLPSVLLKRRINIFTGAYGSGKTEIAINTVLRMKKAGYKTALVDMDIVNPYFRTRDAREKLESRGIRVIAPEGELSTADLAILPSEMQVVFDDKDLRAVLDVGGDPNGARVLGTYHDKLAKEPHTMFLVCNTRRPYSRTAGDIVALLSAIENRSRLQVNYLVNNTNLKEETDGKVIAEGEKILGEVARQTGREIAFTAACEGAAPDRDDLLLLTLFMRLPWEELNS